MQTDPTRMCELLVGLPAVKVLGVDDGEDRLVVMIESAAPLLRDDLALAETVSTCILGRPIELAPADDLNIIGGNLSHPRDTIMKQPHEDEERKLTDREESSPLVTSSYYELI